MSRSRSAAAHQGKNIQICIIEDHEIVRAGVAMLIEREPGIDVVCEAATATEALSLARTCEPPDVILLDISLRSENGLDFLVRLLDEFAPAKVLVLTAIEDVETQLLALEMGASGVVMKDQAPDILVKAIQAVHAGEPWVGRALSAAAINKLSQARTATDRTDPEALKIARLTPREKEVIVVVAQGYNGSRIAQVLNISEATVRHHITSILGKLELANKLELAVYAIHHGLGPT